MAIDNIPVDHTLFIDPGLGGTGWAYFRDRGEPLTSGVIRARAGFNDKGWPDRAYHIAQDVEELIDRFDVLCVGIEFPEYQVSARAHASNSKGDLFKLAFLCGSINYRLNFHHDLINVMYFSPSEWKGQLPKDVVIRRINKIWPSLTVKNHEADAIGMGLAAQGLL